MGGKTGGTRLHVYVSQKCAGMWWASLGLLRFVRTVTSCIQYHLGSQHGGGLWNSRVINFSVFSDERHPAPPLDARSMTLEHCCHPLAAHMTAASWRLLFLAVLDQSQCHEALGCGHHRFLGRPRLPAQYPPAAHQLHTASLTRPTTGHGICGRKQHLTISTCQACRHTPAEPGH